ncbi:YdeI family protein [Cellulomonas sp. KRMCY2]|uniref:YdeI/OmpD-associated family protein n=1 Tax=Cellulomonas sp. KRMCY2 TaxID=1304865 RepID=UPI00045E7C67|nr:YdeI/OmpD-associated family protein [Cellulomonas sp. KRMCY2]
MAVDLPELLLPDAPAWRAWLAEHHDTSPGVWLVLHKKGGTVTSLTYAQALDEALCFGWIDGQGARRDAETVLQRMTPRRARSRWSARNVGHVARLESAGLMHEAGRAQVRAAQADGRWEQAYGGQAGAQVPADLADALAAEPRAQAWFDVLTGTNRYAIIYRITSVKRAETRTRKIAEFVAALAQGRTPYPQRRSPEPDAAAGKAEQ